MRLKLDRESDAHYFRLDDAEIVESKEVQPGAILDFDVRGQMVGIEILRIIERVDPEQLKELRFEKA